MLVVALQGRYSIFLCQKALCYSEVLLREFLFSAGGHMQLFSIEHCYVLSHPKDFRSEI